ncbi:MAG TPA: hypothetical protein PLG31_01500 [Spirochaetota bacterium]|nr:hypothetical protein [Spirochaetota bacterium]
MTTGTKPPGIGGIIKKRRLAGDWNYDDLAAVLKRLDTIDAHAEKLRVVMIVLFILTLVCAVFLTLVGLIILAIPAAALGIVFIMLFFRYRRRDLDNGFREFLAPLLEGLKDDIKSGAPLAVDMNLVPLEDKTHLTETSPKYTKGAYHTCYDRRYRRDTLSLGIRLSDGNTLRLSRTDLLLSSERTKRSSSGKSKTKHKQTMRLIYHVQMRLDPARYRFTGAGKNFEKPVTFTKTPKGHILKTSFSQKLSSTAARADPLFILEQLVKLYSNLKPAAEKE